MTIRRKFLVVGAASVLAATAPWTLTLRPGVEPSEACGKQAATTCCRDAFSMCDGSEGWYDSGYCGPCIELYPCP